MFQEYIAVKLTMWLRRLADETFGFIEKNHKTWKENDECSRKYQLSTISRDISKNKWQQSLFVWKLKPMQFSWYGSF